MVITESAVFVLASAKERWMRRLLGILGRPGRAGTEYEGDGGAFLPGSLEIFDANGSVARVAETAAKVEPTPVAEPTPVESADAAPTDASAAQPLTVAERKARAAAVRALMRARDGRFDQARVLFAEAASLDFALDLSTVPSFWELPRGGQQAAVEGYELAGREQDAMLLSSELAYTFRPKLVRRPAVGTGTAPATGD